MNTKEREWEMRKQECKKVPILPEQETPMVLGAIHVSIQPRFMFVADLVLFLDMLLLEITICIFNFRSCLKHILQDEIV